MDKLKEKVKPLLNAHYATNLLLAASYFLLKNTPVVCELIYESCLLEWREVEILMLLLIFIAVKTRKATTWLQFVSTVCTFSKAANLILYWREGPTYTFLFALVCFLQFVFLPQPVYNGPQNVQYFRAGALDTEIKRDDRITWLVYFFAPWSPPCINFTQVFAEVSNKYAGLNNLKFAKFDCNAYPEVAKRYGVSTSALSKQLPTLILFEKGVETKRRPFVDSRGTVFSFLFSYDNVVKDFDLNRIYHECKANQIVIKPVVVTPQQQEQNKKEN